MGEFVRWLKFLLLQRRKYCINLCRIHLHRHQISTCFNACFVGVKCALVCIWLNMWSLFILRHVQYTDNVSECRFKSDPKASLISTEFRAQTMYEFLYYGAKCQKKRKTAMKNSVQQAPRLLLISLVSACSYNNVQCNDCNISRLYSPDLAMDILFGCFLLISYHSD